MNERNGSSSCPTTSIFDYITSPLYAAEIVKPAENLVEFASSLISEIPEGTCVAGPTSPYLKRLLGAALRTAPTEEGRKHVAAVLICIHASCRKGSSLHERLLMTLREVAYLWLVHLLYAGEFLLLPLRHPTSSYT